MATTTISGTTDTEDAYLYRADVVASKYNYGGATAVGATAQFAGGRTDLYRVLNRVKSAAIPAGTVTGLRYFHHDNSAYGVTPNDCYVNRVAQANSWVEGTAGGTAQSGSVCWTYLSYHVSLWVNWAGSAGCSTATTDYDTNNQATLAAGSANTYRSVTLTPSWASDWRDGGWTNNGIIIKSADEVNFLKGIFGESSENASNQPYWEVDTSAGGVSARSIPAYSGFNFIRTTSGR